MLILRLRTQKVRLLTRFEPTSFLLVVARELILCRRCGRLRLANYPLRAYVSHIDVSVILKAAKSELWEQPLERDRAAYIGFLLCLGCGMRRKEADCLTWDAVDENKLVIRLRPTDHYALKSAAAARDIVLDQKAASILRQWRGAQQSEFVLPGRKPKPQATNPYYRANAAWKSLISFLRRKGVSESKPIHVLRKEAGTQILKRGGSLVDVQRFLGHSDATLASRIYLDGGHLATQLPF